MFQGACNTMFLRCGEQGGGRRGALAGADAALRWCQAAIQQVVLHLYVRVVMASWYWLAAVSCLLQVRHQPALPLVWLLLMHSVACSSNLPDLWSGGITRTCCLSRPARTRVPGQLQAAAGPCASDGRLLDNGRQQQRRVGLLDDCWRLAGLQLPGQRQRRVPACEDTQDIAGLLSTPGACSGQKG